MDFNPKINFFASLDDFFSWYVRIKLINPLYMFITSNKTLKYKTTRYTFVARYTLHDADLIIED
jgi:hypothetical protein